MADKIAIPYDARLKETLAALAKPGLLLVTQGRNGSPNPMAIGWGTIGIVWGIPIFTVLVRPSRHSYTLLEENGDFTVNVMPAHMAKIVMFCGTTSGRNVDKFAEAGLTPMPPLQCTTPIIAESLIAYECRTVMANDVLTDRMDTGIQNSAYPTGDFHRVYYGKILSARAEPGMGPG